MDQPTDLSALANELLTEAATSTAHRAAHTLVGGAESVLRQTMIALTAGAALDEHESPGEATLQVLVGSVSLRSAGEAIEISSGQHAPIPNARHSLAAVEDSAVLLTTGVGSTRGTVTHRPPASS
jgi:quercetin dioxygenase-like cupin family protein